MDWKIAKPKSLCDSCQREIAVGEGFFSWVDFPADEPVRYDACEACFGKLRAPDRIYWRTRRQVPPEKPRRVDFERLREVFQQMVQRPGDNYRDLTYLIALLLLRKRFYKLKAFDTVAGKDVLVITQPRTSITLTLDAPLLDDERIQALREKLTQLVDGTIDWEGIDSSRPATATAPSTAADEPNELRTAPDAVPPVPPA
ncbi:MAG: hypothetical protein U1E76_27895 [Planctomycetota bacterium]